MPAKKKAPETEADVPFVEELKRQWMATIDALVDPLMIVNKSFHITKANKAMATHAGAKDVKSILGKKCYQVFNNRARPCNGCKMKAATEEQEAQNFELEEVKDGQFFEVTSQPFYGPSNDLEGVVQVYRNRTQAHRLQEQLMQSEKLASIGLLAGGIAHEINNPLGGILIFSQMLMRELEPDHTSYQDAFEIEAAAQRCKNIVERLLDFARSQPKDVDKKGFEETVDVVEASKSAMRFIEVSQDLEKIKVDIQWSADSYTVYAEQGNVIQLLLNIYQNACQAMPKGGTLKVRSFEASRNQEKMVVLEISDTGVGISNDHLKRVFDPFFTTKEPGKGTGLGLAICYGYVQEMGGHLEISSKLKSGTTLRIWLPLAKESSVETPAAS